MIVHKRIRLAKRHKTFTNCFGTALYLAGIIKQDKFIPRIWDYDSELERLTILDQPEVYSLAIFRRGTNKYVDHIAIVTGINPILLTHRDILTHPEGVFIEKEPLEEVVARYSTPEMNKIHGQITQIEYRRIPNSH